MMDIGWTEMLVIAIVMIVVVGPKDLPRMLRTIGKMTSKMRSMAGDFQKQFNEALKEAELDDVKKSVDDLRGLNPASQIRQHINPFEKAAADVRAGIQQAMKPTPSTSVDPASPVATPAEPLKNGSGLSSIGVASAPLATPPAELAAAPVTPAAPAAAAASATVTANGSVAASSASSTSHSRPRKADAANGSKPAKPAAPVARQPKGAPAAAKADAKKPAPRATAAPRKPKAVAAKASGPAK